MTQGGRDRNICLFKQLMCLPGLHRLLLLINNHIYYYFYYCICQSSAVLQEVLFSHIPCGVSSLCQHWHISPPVTETWEWKSRGVQGVCLVLLPRADAGRAGSGFPSAGAALSQCQGLCVPPVPGNAQLQQVPLTGSTLHV